MFRSVAVAVIRERRNFIPCTEAYSSEAFCYESLYNGCHSARAVMGGSSDRSEKYAGGWDSEVI